MAADIATGDVIHLLLITVQALNWLIDIVPNWNCVLTEQILRQHSGLQKHGHPCTGLLAQRHQPRAIPSRNSRENGSTRAEVQACTYAPDAEVDSVKQPDRHCCCVEIKVFSLKLSRGSVKRTEMSRYMCYYRKMPMEMPVFLLLKDMYSSIWQLYLDLDIIISISVAISVFPLKNIVWESNIFFDSFLEWNKSRTYTGIWVQC